jgi:hypothetical protein
MHMDKRSRWVVALSLIALLSLALGSWAANAHTQTYKSNLSIHYDKHTASFWGHVGTSSFCQEDRLVSVYRTESGIDTLIGTTFSGHAGMWEGVPSPGPGDYFATVDALHDAGYGHDHQCEADTSSTVTVS